MGISERDLGPRSLAEKSDSEYSEWGGLKEIKSLKTRGVENSGERTAGWENDCLWRGETTQFECAAH